MSWGVSARRTPLFFRLRRKKAALADLVALLAAVALYAKEARKVDGAAAAVMAPYGAWCGVASLSNEEIVRLNP